MRTFEYGQIQFEGSSSAPSHFVSSVGESLTDDLAGVPLQQKPSGNGSVWEGHFTVAANHLGARGWRVVDVHHDANSATWWVRVTFERSSEDRPSGRPPTDAAPPTATPQTAPEVRRGKAF